MSFRLVPKWVTLNGVMAVILHYFTELVYNVIVKELPRFQNPLLIISDHIKRSAQSAIIWVKQTDN